MECAAGQGDPRGVFSGLALPGAGAYRRSLAFFVSSPTSASEQVPAANPAQARWFAEEVHAHDSSLKNYLRHSFPTVRDVEDVVQESYLRVWKRQTLRPITAVTGSVKASVKGFLFQVARRLALDLIRRERASPIDRATDFARLSVVENRAGTHDTVCTNQEFELLLAAIDTLPGRCREVVILRKLHGLSPAEVAQQLGISEETVHVQARRGLQRVQEFLRRHGVIREGQP